MHANNHQDHIQQITWKSLASSLIAAKKKKKKKELLQGTKDDQLMKSVVSSRGCLNQQGLTQYYNQHVITISLLFFFTHVTEGYACCAAAKLGWVQGESTSRAAQVKYWITYLILELNSATLQPECLRCTQWVYHGTGLGYGSACWVLLLSQNVIGFSPSNNLQYS
jgi:hypothetical protein